MDLLALLALVMLASGGRGPAWPAPAPVAPAPKPTPTPQPSDKTAPDRGADAAPEPAASGDFVDDRGNVWADVIARDAANDAWQRKQPSTAIAALQRAHGVKTPDGLYGKKSAQRLATHLVRGSVPPWYVRTKGDKTPMPPPAPAAPAKEPLAASGDGDEPA